ncbi:MAG: cyclophilin-like family protein [Burkholderiales bacterium]
MAAIRIAWPQGSVTADLQPGPTTDLLLAALPCKSTVNTWGEEVYFSLPVAAKPEPGAQQVVDPGTVCFWVEGSALALPWGRTPVSKGDECRLVSPCNVLGKIRGDASVLRSARDGDTIRVEAA